MSMGSPWEQRDGVGRALAAQLLHLSTDITRLEEPYDRALPPRALERQARVRRRTGAQRHRARPLCVPRRTAGEPSQSLTPAGDRQDWSLHHVPSALDCRGHPRA